MRFTINTNATLVVVILFIVAATTYNQIQTTGIIDVKEVGKAVLAGVLGLQALLAHYRNPDGTNAKVAYDATRDSEVGRIGGSKDFD